jgi:phage terminase small subunit
MRRNPPRALSQEAKGLWVSIHAGWQLDEAATFLLEQGLECLDTMRKAQEILKKDGLISLDKYGKATAHPCVAIERDAKASLLRFIRALNLDLEPILALGRPGGSPGWGGTKSNSTGSE